ncbi:hypothetical protein QJS04_geneDACA017811 [Acorus gramineus]|uniref:Uncharacterized protein n=1 Tax=Acorus gramineus TaxID=55184 RepID=A0AAV9BPZ6_ACOGR|nr:hypothetical protein QJS04_geneDACA017811 [Acorus gramineus]
MVNGAIVTNSPTYTRIFGNIRRMKPLPNKSAKLRTMTMGKDKDKIWEHCEQVGRKIKSRTPEFIEAMKAVAEHGPGYVPPSSETIRTSLLCTLKEKAADYVKEIKESWAETDIDKEIEKVKETVRKGGEIKKFIYRFTHVLDCMRSHTMGREIKRPVATRFATNFIMLESIIKLEQPLRFMVASNEWRSLSQTKTTEGREVTQIIQDNLFWEDGREVIEVMEPLIKVLRMVDSEGGTFGYIFEAMDRAKEAISKYYNGEKAKYEPYWTIIDKRWILLHHPMHAMAALLNPHLYYDKLVKHDEETEKGIAEVLRKMFAPDDICERKHSAVN